MMGGNEILDKIVHLTTHTTRIKADATVKLFLFWKITLCFKNAVSEKGDAVIKGRWGKDDKNLDADFAWNISCILCISRCRMIKIIILKRRMKNKENGKWTKGLFSLPLSCHFYAIYRMALKCLFQEAQLINIVYIICIRFSLSGGQKSELVRTSP